MKQVLYKNDIYPYNVRVLLGADEEYIVKTFANLEVEDQSWEIGLDYKTLCDRFENAELDHEGEWGDEGDLDSEVSFMNLVRDKGDDRAFKLLWNFQSENDMTIQNICHESFHAAMSVCQHCNMSLGFKVGEDEHAAYIAGFVGNCAGEMFGFLEEEKDGKEE